MLRPMLAVTAMTVVLSAPALAQQEPNAGESQPMPAETLEAQDQAPAEDKGAQEQAAAAQEDVFIPEQEEGHLLATDIMNVSVIDAEGNDIGGIDDIILDPEGGIFGAVVSVGGFLGIGGKQVAVSWSEFKYSPQEQTANLNVTRADLEAAPAFMTLADIKAEEEAAAAQQRQPMQQPGTGATAPTAPPQ
jgi:sporulation protein YlmC with PRC-barrel domain